MPKPKILILSLAYSPFWSGAELAVKEITDRITDIEFDMITLRFKKEWPKEERVEKNINVYRISSSKLLFPFTAYFKARQLQKKNNYKIIWSIMANRAGFAALFFKLTFPKTKYLLTLQEGDPIDHPQKRAGILWLFVGWMFKYVFRKADRIQTISSYLTDWARQMKAKCPIDVIPNGVDLNKFKKPTAQKQEKKITLVHTGRLVEKNALDDVIKSLKYLPENVTFLSIGDGPDLKKLQKLTEELNLENRVIFLNHLNHEQMAKHLQKADIFIRPSLSEGLGSSFLEAMAIGLPIIGTPVGGIPDFLKDPSTDSGQATGLFCEVRNPKSIAEKVKLLLTDENLGDKISENGQKLVVENYSWNIISQKMKKIFNTLI